MKSKLIFSLLVLFLTACAPQQMSVSSAGGNPNSGIKGQVLIGPMCPVMQVDNPCPNEPYQANLFVLNLRGEEVLRFSSDAEGKFEVKLPPGDYILHPESPEGQPIPYAADVPFTIIPNEFTNIIVTFDSGIR